MNYSAGSRDSQLQRVTAVIAAYDIGRAVAAAVRVCRTMPSVDLLVVADDDSTDDTNRAVRAVDAVVARHSIERGRVSTVETGVKAVAMRGRPDRPSHHILLLSPDLDNSTVEATALVEAVFAHQIDMATAVPAMGREYSGYGPGVIRRLIHRKTGWNCHHPFSHQHCLTRETIGVTMLLSGRYVLEASTMINVLHAGFSVMEVPCNFVHSSADRSFGSLNRPARMFDAVRATISQLSHSDVRSKRRADHKQGIGVPYPIPASARDEAEASDPSDVHRMEVAG